MDTNILIVYYSAYGHTYKLANAVCEGADSIGNITTRLRRVPELGEAKKYLKTQENYQSALEMQKEVKEAILEDLHWADGICWGSPTRFGNMTAQMKEFIDRTGKEWKEGMLNRKPTGFFTSTNTIHGGQETTIITSIIPLIHHGMIIVGTPYAENPQITTDEGIGGSPYGPSTVAGPDGLNKPQEKEYKTARNLGKRVAEIAKKLSE